jgi:hypothetical protein
MAPRKSCILDHRYTACSWGSWSRVRNRNLCRGFGHWRYRNHMCISFDRGSIGLNSSIANQNLISGWASLFGLWRGLYACLFRSGVGATFRGGGRFS